jgi:signal transduction histidine kinase
MKPRAAGARSWSPAAKVAAGATAVIAVVYVIAVIVLNMLVAVHLNEQCNARLAARLTAAAHNPVLVGQPVVSAGSGQVPDYDADTAPVFLWAATAAGTVTAHSPGAPELPAGLIAAHAPHDSVGFTANLGPTDVFRLTLARNGSGWLIAGENQTGDSHTERLVLSAVIIAGPFVLLAMFFGALMVGLRALAPVEQSRRRQVEFTADASHELRTPLSMIRAEADVALSSPREAAEYREALTRIQGESRRLRQLVDDMLWLARFDSRPPPPRDEPVDLVTLARASADRFRAVGPAVTAEVGTGPARISAPPQWIDRRAGVLVR